MTKQQIEAMIGENVMPVAMFPTVGYKTQRNASEWPKNYEKNDMPSMTIPDQSLTVEELIYRHSNGQLLGNGKTPIYEEDLDIVLPSNWEKLDISEKYDFYSQRAAEFEDLQQKLKVKQNEILEVQKQKAIDKAVEAKMEAIRKGKEDSRPTIPVKPKDRSEDEIDF